MNVQKYTMFKHLDKYLNIILYLIFKEQFVRKFRSTLKKIRLFKIIVLSINFKKNIEINIQNVVNVS